MSKVLCFIVRELSGPINGTQTGKRCGGFSVFTCDDSEVAKLTAAVTPKNKKAKPVEVYTASPVAVKKAKPVEVYTASPVAVLTEPEIQ